MILFILISCSKLCPIADKYSETDSRPEMTIVACFYLLWRFSYKFNDRAILVVCADTQEMTLYFKHVYSSSFFCFIQGV